MGIVMRRAARGWILRVRGMVRRRRRRKKRRRKRRRGFRCLGTGRGLGFRLGLGLGMVVWSGEIFLGDWRGELALLRLLLRAGALRWCRGRRPTACPLSSFVFFLFFSFLLSFLFSLGFGSSCCCSLIWSRRSCIYGVQTHTRMDGWMDGSGAANGWLDSMGGKGGRGLHYFTLEEICLGLERKLNCRPLLDWRCGVI
ncbi:hypothetical protein B0T19DRAFT_432324 [Cercophora scortea]|uniref:Uncharacterized protein n=1 Tax=Cercophora scortea TaxID=314031 RepID=A0AAE0IAA3_9PEZI|nr:hypothetical protein B0T19DRAFT_432324 [Cercophora scortea]